MELYEQIYNGLDQDLKDRFAKVKMLIMDFDGVHTDNKVYVNQEGVESVRCDRSDGLGLDWLRNNDLVVMILSKETNPVVAARAKKLQIKCTHGVDIKINDYKQQLQDTGLDNSEVCYIGNDVNDIECIKEAGIGVAVADSDQRVIHSADYVTIRNGGDGAIREICEMICYAKGIHPYANK